MKDELKKEIGLRMRKVRKTLGYTQEQMVSYFNIGRANYSRIEKGEVLPNAIVLDTLRTKFNVSLDWLISSMGKMFVPDREKKENGDRVDFAEYTGEVLELLTYMSKVPMVKHAILGFFQEYSVKYKRFIQEAMDDGAISLDDTDELPLANNQ